MAAASLQLGAASSALGAEATRLHGNASYADHSPNAGVEVSVVEDRVGRVMGYQAWTDEAGNWDVGSIPPGPYRILYTVEISDGAPSKRKRESVGGETINLSPGEDRHLVTTLEGPKPEGMIEAVVIAAEGWRATANVNLLFPGGETEFRGTDGRAPARLFAPTGSYTLEVPITQLFSQLMDQSASVPVSVANGRVTRVHIQLNPLAVPPGTQALKEAQLLAWLNEERIRWGLPGNLVGVPLWSLGCAAHNAYGAENGSLGHFENQNGGGFSPGGEWAGERSVLAASDWRPNGNPWMDAPFHLEQIFTPWIGKTGLDDTRGYQCAATIPGILEESSATPGTIWTFPGDGTKGLPPVEYAREAPRTPNELLGLEPLTGRQLIVWESGADTHTIDVLSAALSSSSGSVEVKWVDRGISGAIIVPVKPLRPFTKYSATVTLAGFETDSGIHVPAKTHSWSFTTGRNNPGGGWRGKPRRRPHPSRPKRRIVRVKYRGKAVVVIGRRFEKGRVVVKRKTLLKRLRKENGKVLARAHAGAKGRFVARIRWPKRKRLALRVYQRGKSTFGLYKPPQQRKRRPLARESIRRRPWRGR